MSQFSVTFQQIKSAIDQLTQLNSQLKSGINNLEATEAQLCTMWEGEAKSTFDNAFKKDKGQMDAFHQAIQQYIIKLNEILEQYIKAENNNASIAANRTYN